VVGSGAAGSFIAPSTPGAYALICLIHPSMIGQLTVVAG
jgi:plastocyanin